MPFQRPPTVNIPRTRPSSTLPVFPNVPVLPGIEVEAQRGTLIELALIITALWAWGAHRKGLAIGAGIAAVGWHMWMTRRKANQ